MKGGHGQKSCNYDHSECGAFNHASCAMATITVMHTSIILAYLVLGTRLL